MMPSPCCKLLCFFCELFEDDDDVLRDAEIGDLLIYQVALCSSDGRTVSFRAKLLDDAFALVM